jgi:hypothetical protein
MRRKLKIQKIIKTPPIHLVIDSSPIYYFTKCELRLNKVDVNVILEESSEITCGNCLNMISKEAKLKG